MNIISHRGNLDGPKPEKENHPDYIKSALSAGFDVEVDVWFENDKWFLGHDGPQYEIDKRFFKHADLWIHAKNIAAFARLSDPKLRLNTFFHDTDQCTLTTGGWIWTYPGELICNHAQVAVMPERVLGWDISKAGALCTDFPRQW